MVVTSRIKVLGRSQPIRKLSWVGMKKKNHLWVGIIIVILLVKKYYFAIRTCHGARLKSVPPPGPHICIL